MSFTFPTDHPEDFIGEGGIRMGAGWVEEVDGLGWTVLDHAQETYAVLPATAQRAIALEEARGRRAQAEEEAAAEDRAMAHLVRWRSLGGQTRPPSELLADVSLQMDRADRKEASRLRAAVAAGELALEPVPRSGLRSEQFEMRRQQRERAEAQAARPAVGADVDQLQAEITHLRALLAAERRERATGDQVLAKTTLRAMGAGETTIARMEGGLDPVPTSYR